MSATRTLTDSSIQRWSFPALPPRALALLAVVGATSIWGSAALATKANLIDLPPLTVSCARLAIGDLVVRPLVARSGAQPASGPWPALLGLPGFVDFVLLRNPGFGAAPASHGSLIEGGETHAGHASRRDRGSDPLRRRHKP